MKRVCPKCKGCGSVEFNGAFADTLELLRKQPSEINGADLAKLAKCKPTAMCNRLVELEELGFVVSRKYGRERFWRAIES